MELRKLNKLPAEFREAASLAVAKAIEDSSPVPVAEVIRQAFRDEYWEASIDADDATEYVLWLFISKTCSGRLEKDWTERFMPLISRSGDPA